MITGELRGGNRPNLAEALEWIGSRVDDVYGSSVGRLDDVWIDPGTGAPRWLLIKDGHFGGRTTLIPFDDATAGAGHVWIPYERELVRNAPAVEPGTPLTHQLESALHRHFSAAGASSGSAPAGSRQPAPVDRDRAAAGPQEQGQNAPEGGGPQGPVQGSVTGAFGGEPHAGWRRPFPAPVAIGSAEDPGRPAPAQPSAAAQPPRPAPPIEHYAAPPPDPADPPNPATAPASGSYPRPFGVAPVEESPPPAPGGPAAVPYRGGQPAPGPPDAGTSAAAGTSVHADERPPPEPASLPSFEGLDQPYEIELEIAGFRVIGEVRNLRIRPSRRD